MEEYYFKQNDNETYTIMAYKGDLEEVTVPSVYAGKPVTILYDSLFKNHEEIRSVSIPEGIEDIGGFVFDGCHNLKKISLPSTLINLWQYAFVRSTVEEIVLPDNLVSIPPYAFKDCRQLKKVICGKGLKKIHAHAFEGCVQMKEIICDPAVEITGDLF